MLRQKGFSLIELVITLAILAILASIAYAAYSKQVQKSRRTDVTEALMKRAALQERYYLSVTPNAYAGNDNINDIGGARSANGYYTITASLEGCAPVGDCFTLTATVPEGSPQQADTDCQIFTIDNLGRKRSYRGGTASAANLTENCW